VVGYWNLETLFSIGSTQHCLFLNLRFKGFPYLGKLKRSQTKKAARSSFFVSIKRKIILKGR
jgi:hypothetical protein